MDKLFTSYRRSMLPSGTRRTCSMHQAVHDMRRTVGDRSRKLRALFTASHGLKPLAHLATGRGRKSLALLAAGGLALSAFLPSLGTLEAFAAPKSDDTITLRVCNWEEYIDQGGWSSDEVIDLPSGDIIG